MLVLFLSCEEEQYCFPHKLQHPTLLTVVHQACNAWTPPPHLLFWFVVAIRAAMMDMRKKGLFKGSNQICFLSVLTHDVKYKLNVKFVEVI